MMDGVSKLVGKHLQDDLEVKYKGLDYIVMADVKDSRSYSGPEMEVFFKAVKEANLKKQQSFASPLTVTLGVEGQGVTNGLKEAVEAIIFLEEELVRQKSEIVLRYVVHRGKIDSAINEKIAHAMVGPGLTMARELLERHKKQERIDERFVFDLGEEVLNRLLENAFFVLEGFWSEWKVKSKSLDVAHLFLKHGDYLKVAREENEEKGNMWRKEKSLRFREYKRMKELLSQLMQ